MQLLEIYKLGRQELKNRLVMSPMTRSRAIGNNVPNPLSGIYYSQRATAGLIITEGSQVSKLGVGYFDTPGIYSPEQVEAWKNITDVVHNAGGRIFIQLWHVGRVSHSDFHNGRLPVAPSAIPISGEIRTSQGKKKFETPHALEINEINEVVEQFRSGAKNALEAGFDGIELHGANGYLLDQFLRDGSNHRNDKYGGKISNRLRLPAEIIEAVMEVWDPACIGYKISPNFSGNSMSDSDPLNTFSCLMDELNRMGIGYVNVCEFIAGPMAVPADSRISSLLRKKFEGAFIVNGGYDSLSGNKAIESGEADLVAFGTKFLSNPDLPERFRTGAALNQPDASTFYGGGEKGYTDYPFL